MNPLVGVTVGAYEACSLQYALLTEKAAWYSPRSRASGVLGGAEDGRTWT